MQLGAIPSAPQSLSYSMTTLSQLRQRANYKKNNPRITKIRDEIGYAQKKIRDQKALIKVLKKKLLELQVKRDASL